MLTRLLFRLTRVLILLPKTKRKLSHVCFNGRRLIRNFILIIFRITIRPKIQTALSSTLKFNVNGLMWKFWIICLKYVRKFYAARSVFLVWPRHYSFAIRQFITLKKYADQYCSVLNVTLFPSFEIFLFDE